MRSSSCCGQTIRALYSTEAAQSAISYQTTLYGANGLAGMAARRYPAPPPPGPQPDCSSSICSSQLLPLSHCVHPPLLLPKHLNFTLIIAVVLFILIHFSTWCPPLPFIYLLCCY